MDLLLDTGESQNNEGDSLEWVGKEMEGSELIMAYLGLLIKQKSVTGTTRVREKHDQRTKT
jgi:hypothetical protein